MKKRLARTVLAFAIISTLLLSIGLPASAFVPSDFDLYVGKYPEPVTVTIGRQAASSTFPDGMTFEDNPMLDWLRNTANIDVKYEWVVPSGDTEGYYQKTSLVLASGDMPDLMLVRRRDQLDQLIRSGMVEDITDVFEQYASPLVKDIFASFPEGVPTRTVMYDDRMMALPSLMGGDAEGMMWVRKDWLDKLGLEEPKTMEDVKNIARAFIEQDPGGNGPGGTIGISTTPRLGGDYNSMVLDPLFGAYNAFPRQWYQGDDGKYVYGTMQPQVKDALANLAEMYAEGLLDKEFAVKDFSVLCADLASGKSGITFGPYWIYSWPLGDTLVNNDEAVWVPFLAPLDENGNFNTYRQNPTSQWFVVRKGYEHPEVAVKLYNIAAEQQASASASVNELCTIMPSSVSRFNSRPEVALEWGVWPMMMEVRYSNETALAAAATIAAIDDGQTDAIYRAARDGLAKTHEALAGERSYEHRLVLEAYMAQKLLSQPNIKLIDNVYPDITETYELRGANLETLENEALLKIVMGTEPLDYYDTFVAEWMAQGGEQWTEEVNALFGA